MLNKQIFAYGVTPLALSLLACTPAVAIAPPSCSASIGGSISGCTVSGTLPTFVILNTGSVSGFNSGGGPMGIQITWGNRVTSFTNYGTINVSAGSPTRGIYNTGLIDNLLNAAGGMMSGGVRGFDTSRATATPVIGTFRNDGTISGGSVAIYNYRSTITSLTNTNLVTSSGGDGVDVSGIDGLIGTLSNSGTITGAARGISVDSGGTITSLINDGAITGTGLASYGILNTFGTLGVITNRGSIAGTTAGIGNAGTIGTLTNYQGGNPTSGTPSLQPLTYIGAVPTNYYIYVTSTTHYGQVNFTNPTGSMAFGIDPGSTLVLGAYSDVLKGVTGVTGTSGTFGTYVWNLTQYDVTNHYWTLVVGLPGPSASNSLIALSANAAGVRNAVNARASEISGILETDCATFDTQGVCLSFQTRYFAQDRTSEGAGFLTIGYRLSSQWRAGAFIDYRVSQNRTAHVKFDDDLPTFGGFLSFSNAPDGTGLQARIAAAINKGKINVTRDNSLSDTEAGSGQARLNSTAVGAELGWGIALDARTIATPYIGLRTTDAARGAYSEALVVGSVDYPVSYSAFTQRLVTALAGLRLKGMLSDTIGYQLGAGAEYDAVHKDNGYAGTSGISNLPSFNIANAGASHRMRAIGAAGLHYQINKTQRLTGNISLRGQTYSSQPAFTALAGYQIAF